MLKYYRNITKLKNLLNRRGKILKSIDKILYWDYTIKVFAGD